MRFRLSIVAIATLGPYCSDRYKSWMTKTAKSRETLLPLLAEYVLAFGISDASLRPMAKAAQTSDRMLIYHFGSKNQLIAELLAYLADAYAAALAVAMPRRAATRQQCAKQVLAITRAEPFAAYMRLWWQIVAGAAQGHREYAQSGEKILGQLLLWLEAQMPDDDPDPQSGAKLIFTLIEGAQMLEVLGCKPIADAAIAQLGEPNAPFKQL